MRRALPLLAVLLLAGCAAEPVAEESLTPTSAEAPAIVLVGETGDLTITGDMAADLPLGPAEFNPEWAASDACDPPEDSSNGGARTVWALKIDGPRGGADAAAYNDAVRVVVHYECPEHYDVVDEALR